MTLQALSRQPLEDKSWAKERDKGIEDMKKRHRVFMAVSFFIILTIFVGTLVGITANAQQRKKSSAKKATSIKKGKASSKVAVKRGKSKVRSSRVARKGSRSKSVASARRRRARARYLARLRAIRARDAALRNITAGSILKDDATGEDPEIRAAAVKALQGRSGTVVVMDPNNGRVFTVVNQRMALGSPVKPCSTVKMIVGLAALHEGVFDPDQDVQISSRSSMNLTDAMARSNNPVFQVLGRLLGYERVMKYATDFGFGSRTGVNYKGESDGFLPDEGEEETGHMSSHGDGFGVTAIQLAAFTCAIANGGELYTPRVLRNAEEARNFVPEVRRKIVMSPEDRMRLLAGMTGAVNYGTAKLAYNPLGQVAGKTGSCRIETRARDNLGLFTSFSSVDDPRVVVTVITSGSTEAGSRAAQIAGRIYADISPLFFKDRSTVPAASAGTEIPEQTSTNDSSEAISRKTEISASATEPVNGEAIKPEQKAAISFSGRARNVVPADAKGSTNPPPARASERVKIITYKVRRGDTLSGIAERYDISIRDITKLNSMSASAKLRAGRLIKIPTRSRP
jgi:penicillin-binding protein 2